MNERQTYIEADDKKSLHTYIWLPDNVEDLNRILLLVHGSVEHAGRYKEFAQFLTKHGVGVYAFDLRGHGYSTDYNSKEFAHIAYKTGWDQLLDDVKVMHEKIKADYPQLPKFLFGHSMGSFLVRDYISSRSSDFDGLLLSGTTRGNTLELNLLLKVVKFMTLFYDPTYKSKFIHNQIYKKLNAQIKNARTDVDFISTDRNEVQKYIDDKLSGATISLGYAHEMGKGLLRVGSEEVLKNISKDLPILLVSGEDDPVGGKDAEDVKALYKIYKDLGINDVSIKIYDNARHELLNELNREQVMQDILEWLNSKS